MEASKIISVVSRKSQLSLLQVKEIFSLFPSIKYDQLSIDSFGDKNKQISLIGDIASDFFTRELDDIIISGDADIAIHSAKDLPYPLPRELEVITLFEAFDRTDSLVSYNNQTLAQLRRGAKVGTSSATRKAELLKIRPDLEVMSIRGTIMERITLVDNGTIDALIVASCALKRLGLENRITERLPFRTHALQGSLAIVAKKDNSRLRSIFLSHDIRLKYGKVTLVGFGPGNPDYLTIGGDKALTNADIIFHDELLDIDFLSKYQGEKVYVGKRKDKHSHSQEEINQLIYEAAIEGKQVVRLKGGDVMIFAHGREEIDFLKSRFVQVDVIPGITAAIALSATTQIPLTHRGIASSVAFATGHSSTNLTIPNTDTLVFYMGGSNSSEIAKAVITQGKTENTPVALVHNISLPDQQIFYSTLKDLRDSENKYPTPILIVIGEVVSFENPSPKQNILVTGTSKEEYNHLENIVHTPLIKIEKIESNTNLYSVINDIGKLDWIIFTSRYGVRYFFEAVQEQKMDIRKLANIKIGSVGKVTSRELAKHHIQPDIESETESAEGLVSFFKEKNITSQQILLPRSNKGLKYLSDELSKLNNYIIDIPTYRNIVDKEVEKQDLSKFSKIIFSSPSGIDAFLDIYGQIPQGIEVVTKGKTTQEALKLKLI